MISLGGFYSVRPKHELCPGGVAPQACLGCLPYGAAIAVDNSRAGIKSPLLSTVFGHFKMI